MDVLALIDKLDDLIHNAKPVPLTDQVRVDREEIYDILDQMRATIPRGDQAGALDRQGAAGDARRGEARGERIIGEARGAGSADLADKRSSSRPSVRREDIIDDARRQREREIRLGGGLRRRILSTLEVNLDKFLVAVRRGRERLQGREEAEVG
jgi:hypothetical protein